jgi:hypothetical protein
MNSSEMFNRQKKAARLAEVLFECDATDEDVVLATPAMWKLCAEAATTKFNEKVYPPNSQATVYAVLEALARVRKEAEVAKDQKAEGEWLDRQKEETGADRCPPRE